MDVVFKKSAAVALRRLQPKKEAALRKGIEAVAADPFSKDNNLKPLKGVPNGFRRRFGDLRVSYVVDTKAGVLEVFEIAPRGGAYR